MVTDQTKIDTWTTSSHLWSDGQKYGTCCSLIVHEMLIVATNTKHETNPLIKSTTNLVHFYSPILNKWYRLPNFPISSYQYTMTYVNETLYLIRGESEIYTLDLPLHLLTDLIKSQCFNLPSLPSTLKWSALDDFKWSFDRLYPSPSVYPVSKDCHLITTMNPYSDSQVLSKPDFVLLITPTKTQSFRIYK